MTTEAQPPTVPPFPQQQLTRRQIMLIVIAGVLIIGAIAAIWLLISDDPAPTTFRAVPAEKQGFQVGIQVEPIPDRAVYQIWAGEVRDKLRLGWIKQQVRWNVVEPESGQYDWAELDAALTVAVEFDLKVMLSIAAAPDWAREPGTEHFDWVGPPGDPQDYANFLIALLERYPDQIHAIEVWNEMNIDREWAKRGKLRGATACGICGNQGQRSRHHRDQRCAFTSSNLAGYDNR